MMEDWFALVIPASVFRPWLLFSSVLLAVSLAVAVAVPKAFGWVVLSSREILTM